MRLAASTLIYLEEPYLPAMTRLIQQGYRAIELFGDLPTIDLRAATPADVETIRRLCADHGVELSLHGPCWDQNPASANRGHRDDVVAQYREAIRFCRDAGIATMVVHSGTRSDSKLPVAEARRYAGDTIGRCAVEAERCGVTLAVENVGYGAANIIRTPADLLEIVEAAGSPAVGITYDVGHGLLQGLEPAEAVRAWGPRLRHLHLHSNSGKSDDHWRCDTGAVDFAPVVRALKEMGFGGTAAIEVYAETDREEAMAASRALLERLWQG